MSIRSFIAVSLLAQAVFALTAAANVRQQGVLPARGRELGVMHGDARVQAFVSTQSSQFRTAHRASFLERYNSCFSWYPTWSHFYANWNRLGFHGGFFFPLRPVYDIDSFFWNPFVYWLWGDGWDDSYYEIWYGAAWYSANVLRTRFARPGVFFPTESIRDLARIASVWPASEQGSLRLGFNDLVNRLQVALSSRSGGSIELERNDVVVTNAQVLESAVVLDGFVGTESHQFAFKALLGLDDVAQNLLVAPRGSKPTDEELGELNTLNERVRELGGLVDYALGRVRGD